jgi:hypothetical protein
MPMIAINRFRLERMNGNAALQVVAQAHNLIDPPIAEEVVRFVAAGPERAPLGKLVVEPALLSVVCRELNNKRRETHDSKITESLLEGSHDQMLTDFYERSLRDLPLTVRNFIEDQLITASGYRNSVAVEDAKLKSVSNESIDILVRSRLLRLEERSGVQRLELTHDLLTGVVRSSRDQRRRQEEAEAARLAVLRDEEQKRVELQNRQEQERREREQRSLLVMRIAAMGFAALTSLAIAGLVFALYSRSETKKAELKEREAHQEATQALSRIEQGLLIRQAALSGDQNNLNELLTNLARDDKIRFQVGATDLHYKTNNLETYKFELFPEKDTLPTGKDAVVFITYLANHPSFQNTLMTGTQKRDFRVSYWGWGCLSRIVALTEYADPTKPPTVTVFDMCELLGWNH